MSNLKPEVRTAWEFPPQSRVVLAAEYEALAQRCRELEADRNHFAIMHQLSKDERGTLRDEVKRFREGLGIAQKHRDDLLAEIDHLLSLLKQAAALLPRDYPGEESLARQIDKEIAEWNAPTTGDTPAA